MIADFSFQTGFSKIFFSAGIFLFKREMFLREREREVDSTDTCSVCEATKENREKANEQQQKKNAGNRRNRTGRVIRIPSLEGPIQKKTTKTNKNKQTSMNEYEIKGTRQKRKQKRDSGTIGI